MSEDSNHSDLASPNESIPEADVKESTLHRAADVTGSYFWLLTLVCLAVAIGLVWWSMPDRGIEIEIRFPEGHGLESEDVVRFRGIEVGVVDEVKLNSELTGVDVKVNLKPFAYSLAREGTRFWIVRPELSLAGISGLETAVGNKYIGMIPGDPEGNAKYVFEGLANSPPDALVTDGMEIILRGEKKHSITMGSPLTCRGVEIGRVLSVGLSQDARFVDVRARVFDKYTKIVTTESKFWATSGVDLDFSFGEGIRLDMESLETIARGGVSMLTTESGGEPVKPGHPFLLYQKPDESWLEAARMVSTAQVKLGGVVPLEARWSRKGLLGKSSRQASFNGIPFRDGAGKTLMFVPRDMLELPSRGESGSLRLVTLLDEEQSMALAELPSVDPDGEQATPQPIVALEVPSSFAKDWLTSSSARTAAEIEDGLVVRATPTESALTYLHYPIEKLDIKLQDGAWILGSFDGDRDVWHGSPVLSATDGKLIGQLLIEKRGARVILFDSSWPENRYKYLIQSADNQPAE
jgi:paraquat-inducible protein B